MSVPLRTCIGCREISAQTQLIRIVLLKADGGAQRQASAVLDSSRRFHGRGAWVHANPDCVAKAKRSKAVARTFRTAVMTETLFQDLEEYLLVSCESSQDITPVQSFVQEKLEPYSTTVSESGSER